MLVLLGVAMMFPVVQDLLERPFARIRQREVSGQHSGFVLGLALGAVYVPCAGPVLAAITVAGATGKIGWRTVALTVAFAIGTAIPLLFFALAGRGVAERVRAFRDRQRIVRVAAGLVVIGLAVALTFNVTDALQRTVPDYTASLNKALNKAGAEKDLGSKQSEALAQCAQEPATTLQNCGKAPAISGTQQWFNTPGDTALPAAALTGKVVPGRFLGLLLHQLPAGDSARRGVVFGVPERRSRGHRRAHARVRVRARGQQRRGRRRSGSTSLTRSRRTTTTRPGTTSATTRGRPSIWSTRPEIVRHVSIGEGDYAAPSR